MISPVVVEDIKEKYYIDKSLKKGSVSIEYIMRIDDCSKISPFNNMFVIDDFRGLGKKELYDEIIGYSNDIVKRFHSTLRSSYCVGDVCTDKENVIISDIWTKPSYDMGGYKLFNNQGEPCRVDHNNVVYKTYAIPVEVLEKNEDDILNLLREKCIDYIKNICYTNSFVKTEGNYPGMSDVYIVWRQIPSYYFDGGFSNTNRINIAIVNFRMNIYTGSTVLYGSEESKIEVAA